MKPFVILLAIAVGLFRPVLLFVEFGPHVDAGYQALAHLLVGGLIGAWYLVPAPEFRTPLDRTVGLVPVLLLAAFCQRPHWQIRLASALTWVEIICATIKILGG